jgi:hypothetical protein
MNVYILWTRNGNRYFARASYSFDAIRKVEALTKETVSSWDIATSMPANATIL